MRQEIIASREASSMVEKHILERLSEPSLDGEYWYESDRWSFLSSDIAIGYCPFVDASLENFNGEIEGLGLPWSQKRIDAIESGEEEPNQIELQQWVNAHARYCAKNNMFTHSAFIVPIKSIDESLQGTEVALFVGNHEGDAEEPPGLEGVFDSAEDAESHLRTKGAIA